MGAESERVATFWEARGRAAPSERLVPLGPYVSERQWGTVREDYSPDGEAWTYFPTTTPGLALTDGAKTASPASLMSNSACASGWRSGTAGTRSSKERPFGLTGAEANHGEDVKDYWWYLDALPSHAWNRWRYHYPQPAFPYEDLREENIRRGKNGA